MKQRIITMTALVAGCFLLSGCLEQQSPVESEASSESSSQSHQSKAFHFEDLLNGKSAVEAFHNVISNGNVVVDFYATWCPPCKAMLPIVDELSHELDNVKFVKIDVDKFSEIASGFKIGDESFSVGSVPQFFMFKDGKLVDHLKGGLPLAQFKERIKNKLDLE